MHEATGPMNSPIRDQGISLRQAALIGGIGVLIMVFAAPFAEFAVYAKLVVPGNVEETVRNIAANRGLFLAGLFAYLVTFICDVLVAWAFYILLTPVNRSLSLLTAWFRLVYTVIALVAMFKLASVFRLVTTPDHAMLVGADQLHAQVLLLLNSFRYEWSAGLILFGIHLGLLGYLVYRSGYIPRILGVLLVISGPGYLLYYSSPYLFPNADLQFVMITFFAEPVFMIWLLARGWKIEVPTASKE